MKSDILRAQQSATQVAEIKKRKKDGVTSHKGELLNRNLKRISDPIPEAQAQTHSSRRHASRRSSDDDETTVAVGMAIGLGMFGD